MTIWQFQTHVSKRLLKWSVVSVAAGLAMLPIGKFWRGFGLQALTWGVIDAAIAIGGGKMAENRWHALPNPHAPEVVEKEARSLSRLLWLNAGLDLLYILGGLRWAKRDGAFNRGSGWGVVVQGAFLLVFDVLHALRIPYRQDGVQ